MGSRRLLGLGIVRVLGLGGVGLEVVNLLEMVRLVFEGQIEAEEVFSLLQLARKLSANYFETQLRAAWIVNLEKIH